MADRIRWRKYQTNAERLQEQEIKHEINIKRRMFEYKLSTGYWTIPDQAFWSKWQAMKRAGFKVTKFDGRYYVHQPQQEPEEKPEPKPKVVAARKRKRPSVFIPHTSKGSLCLDCGHLDIILRSAKHQACTECGAGTSDEEVVM